MLSITKYINALYLFFVACTALFMTTMNLFFATTDTATRAGGLLGAAAIVGLLALPYYFTFQAANTKTASHVKRAMVASTSLLALCALIGVFGAFSDPTLAFAALVWGIPALFAVNTFKSWPRSQDPSETV